MDPQHGHPSPAVPFSAPGGTTARGTGAPLYANFGVLPPEAPQPSATTGIIAPPAGAHLQPPYPSRGSGRTGLRRGVAAALVLLALGGSGVGFYAYKSATQWRHTAQQNEAQAKALTRQLAAANEQVKKTANLKAQAEDQRALAAELAENQREQAEFFETATAAAQSVASELNECVREGTELTNVVTSALSLVAAGGYVSSAQINSAINGVNITCEKAKSDEATLNALLTAAAH